MSFLTVCRKARAWQQHMKALSSFNSLQSDLIFPSSAWLQVQRFNGTSTSPLAAAAEAADVQPAASVSHPPLETRRKYPKRRRLVEADVLDMAKRVFEMPLDKDFLDEATETPDSSSPSAQPQPQISSELLEEHNDRLAAVDKKREKYPVRPGETLESWFKKHKQDLQPFLKFLESHGAHPKLTVAHLYSAGYWGRSVMLPYRASRDTKDSKKTKTSNKEESGSKSKVSAINEESTIDEPALYPFEKMFNNWSDALRKEDIHLTATDLLLRWPRMLTRQPFKIGATLAILRAALPEGTDVHDIVDRFPRIFGIAPLELQNTILRLHLATEGELPHMLATVPRLLTVSLEGLLSNLRMVREHSRSSREFKSFLYSSPGAVERHPEVLQNAATKVRQSLEEVLPPGVDAFEMIKAKPQLLLVKGPWLKQRWRDIEDAVCLIDGWKEEFDTMIADAAAMSTHKELDKSDSAPFTERVGDGSDAILAPPPPEWLRKDMDLHSLGVNSELNTQKLSKNIDLDNSDDSTEKENDDEMTPNEDEAAVGRRGRNAYSALSEALWMRPWRIQRLEYMAEQVPEEASRVSFVSAMAVTLEQFEERYPEFNDWVAMKQEESEYYQNKESNERHEDVF